VLGARVFTSRQGQALDVFYLQDVSGKPFGSDNPKVLQRIAAALEAADRGELPAREPPKTADFGRTAAFSITPTVMFDNEASEISTVVEASGRDRPGLMAALAGAIADEGLSILSAHIDSYGERAVDAFYVIDGDGAKFVDPKRGGSLKGKLMSALEEPELAAPARQRPNMQRARASVAR
jgi:[protein-PII] uridylyltransferase